MTYHGHTRKRWRSPTYNSWRAMIYRCTYERHPRYADYGGRGIQVCDEWRKFARFLADVGERPDGMTLDRIDVNGDYEPGNVTWSNVYTQRWNRRDMIATVEYAEDEESEYVPPLADPIPF